VAVANMLEWAGEYEKNRGICQEYFTYKYQPRFAKQPQKLKLSSIFLGIPGMSGGMFESVILGDGRGWYNPVRAQTYSGLLNNHAKLKRHLRIRHHRMLVIK